MKILKVCYFWKMSFLRCSGKNLLMRLGSPKICPIMLPVDIVICKIKLTKVFENILWTEKHASDFFTVYSNVRCHLKSVFIRRTMVLLNSTFMNLCNRSICCIFCYHFSMIPWQKRYEVKSKLRNFFWVHFSSHKKMMNWRIFKANLLGFA